MTKRLVSPSNVRTAVLLAGVAVLVSSCGWSLWDSPMTTVRPRSDFGKWIDEIFMLISWTDAGDLHPGRGGARSTRAGASATGPGAPIPKQVHGHTVLEISWTIAFAVILLIIGIPTIRIIFKTQEAPAATDLRVDVAGKQWWWEFTYPEFKITTANELHIPVGQTAAFYLHAPDVIHSFWMPASGGKRDVVPHRVNRIVLTPEVPGEYLGQCAEYCGMSHANMRFRVIVHPKGEFEQWVKNQQAPPVESTDPLAQQGKALFAQSTCVGCHTITGVAAGQIGPNLTHFGSRKSLAANMMANTPRTSRSGSRTPTT
jgi:cytochrome c oxidase subunit 2